MDAGKYDGRAVTDKVDVVVIGAGIVGLAIARRFAKAGREVVVLEKNAAFGEETSSRNSEVIHAGLYYKKGGMRARLCAPGKVKLYDYCASHHVNHLRCEKLIVAHTDDEIARLKSLVETSRDNGVDDLVLLSREDARRLEPQLECAAALLSPSTGIIDSHGLMLALLGDLEDAGGVLAVNAPIVAGDISHDVARLTVGGETPMELDTNLVINSAGLWSDRVAQSIDGIPKDTIPALYYGKGQYFTYGGKAPFNRLIYPVPGRDSLGIHYTRDLGGQGKLGPDICYVESNTDYAIDESRRNAFAKGVQRFWPDLDPGELYPGYAGIRPKSASEGHEGDFIIQGHETHGLSRYIGLYGMESPALTSCLAIADHVFGITP